jgi:hypothetical protein
VDIGRKKKTTAAAKKEGEVGSLPLILFYSILLCWFFVLRAMPHVLLLLWAWVVNFSSVDFKTWNTVLISLIVIFTP